MATTRAVDLTEVEANLRNLLVDVAHHIDTSAAKEGDSATAPPSELRTTPLELRFTGGWVRDKLLGVPSHDIDVGINKMTGFQFGLKMKEYLDAMDEAQKRDKYSFDAAQGAAKELHKIAANPEKSKHLETVTTKILGLDIDLVNLRKETYSADSRNPQMEFGTPEEDALRRDATVNALFYNIHTGQVEDFTRRGLEDMEKQIIRTPLEPYQTFKDDPLRVLRLIRFASRLGYSIDPAAEQCMENPEIQEALRLKISRERVGIELEKMLKGPDPRLSVALIDRLNLYTTIFSTSESTFHPHREWAPAYTALSNVLSSDVPSPLNSVLLRSDEDKYLAWLVTCFIPWADAPDEPPKKPGKAPTPMVQKVAFEGIKSPTKQANILASSVNNLKPIISLKDRFLKRTKTPDRPLAENEEDPLARDTLGMAIRSWGASWRQQVVFAMLFEVTEHPDREQGIVSEYAKFVGHLQSESLLEAYSLKPLITGTELAQALDTKPGPWMRAALEEVVAWQLMNPTATDAAAAIEQVKKKQGELPSRLATHFLRLTVRPLFAPPQTSPDRAAPGHHPAVTEKGRQNISADSLSHRFSNIHILSEEEEANAKPWKNGKDGEDGMSLLRWVLGFCQPAGDIRRRWLIPGQEDSQILSESEKQSNQPKAAFVQRNWPLLIPPVLTVLDDSDPVTKATGCHLTEQLLAAAPPSHLHRTGLAQVFENALLPCLTYLPSLTPAAESSVLLTAAHGALRALAHARYPPPSPLKPLDTPTDTPTYSANDVPAMLLNNDPNHEPFIHALDTLLRRGILAPFAHVGTEHPDVAIAILRALPPVLHALGVETVRHLQRLVPLLTNVLSDPFALVKVELPVAALVALIELVRCAWPRIERWRWNIANGVANVWVRAIEEAEEQTRPSEGVEELRDRCKDVVGILAEVMEAGGAIQKEWRQQMDELATADGRLEELFAGTLS